MGEPKHLGVVAIVRSVLLVFGVQLVPILVSQRWGWVEAWVFAGLQIGSFVVGRAIAFRVHPDLLRRRATALDQADAKPWDKKTVAAMMLASTAALVIAGLEARWRAGPVFPIVVKVAAAVALLAGNVFGSWALIENRFFEGLVRIQRDRGHVVVSTGPYALVRHPGYAGALVANLAIPFLLDARWAWLGMGLASALLIYRTAREDLTLVNELDGYREYTGKTRHRLLPGVW